MSAALDKVPSIATAKLPGVYQQAKDTLAKCERLDECKGWADKAAAMASYARQAKDTSLEKMAMRIRVRAIRQAGVLLKQLDRPEQGGRPKKNGIGDGVVSRNQAAADVGMSKRQKETALRIASVPEAAFTKAVESDNPPTVSSLAARGTKRQPEKPFTLDVGGRTPQEIKASTAASGLLREASAVADKLAPAVVARGLFENERAAFVRQSRVVVAWLDRVNKELKRL